MVRIHKRGLKTAIESIFVVAVALCGLPAIADDSATVKTDPVARRLHGDYGLTAQYSCVRTPFQSPPAGGFDPVTGRLLIAADVANAVGSGVMQFSKDGTVGVDVVGIELETNKLQPGDIPVSSGIKYGCKGTYSFTADGRIAVSFPSCNVSPPRPGITITVGALELAGFVGRGRNAMVLSAVKGNVETVAVAVGGTVVNKRERICVASFALERIGGGE